MRFFILAAGALCIVLGLVHSLMGEYLIFKGRRKPGTLVPTISKEGLKEKYLPIIWATWHLVSLLGFGIGLILLSLSISNENLDRGEFGFIIDTLSIAMLASSVLVFIATKGRHMGWFVLLVIAILLFLGK